MDVIGHIRYTKLEQIGIGEGMNSTVYRATDPHLNGEIAVTINETVSPIERIDHPHTRLCEAPFCIDRLLGENSIVGKLALQSGDDQLVGNHVSLSDRLDVVIVILLFDMERAIVLLENCCTRRPCELAGDAQFAIECFLIS